MTENGSVDINADELLSQLRSEPDSVDAIATSLNRLRGKMALLDGHGQASWHAVFKWLHAASLQDRGASVMLFAIAALAAEMNLWRDAARIFIQLLCAQLCPLPHYQLQVNLGVAYWQVGAHDAARRYLRRARIACSGLVDEAAVSRRLAQLDQLSSECRLVLGAQRIRLPLNDPALLASTCVLYATLLGKHHTLGLWRLQRDEKLANDVGVQRLTDPDDASQWIERTNANELALAMLHPVCGLIGVAALLVSQEDLASGVDAARFYLWIGRDFQRQGFGTQALGLLRALARRHHIDHLFSTVHVDNLISRRVLEKNGGRRLPFSVIDARPNHDFFHVGLDQCDADLHASLAALLSRTDAVERLCPLQGGDADERVIEDN